MVGEEAEGEATTEHRAVHRTCDWSRQSAETAEPIKKIDGHACSHSQGRRRSFLYVGIAPGAEVLTHSLQQHTPLGTALLQCKPSDCCLHVARHSHTECVEAQWVVKLESRHTLRNHQTNVLIAIAPER